MMEQEEKNGCSRELYIHHAKTEDAERIFGLMTDVHEQMEAPSLFVCDDLPFVKRHIVEEGFVLIAEDSHGEIMGSLIVRFPLQNEDNLGREIGLSGNELNRVAHMESGVVSKNARGQGLLCRMMTEAEQILQASGYRYLMGTVSPENPASYRGFEKLQYQLVTTKEKYGGKIRRIYCKELERICFRAVIESAGDGGGAYVRVPINIKKVFGKGRLKVTAEFDGILYQGSIVNMGVRNDDGTICYIIGVRKEIQKQIGKTVGDEVDVKIIPCA